MPWKECHVMDERLRFVARLLEGETMVALCEEFGISRKTGHKIYQRYRQIGVQGLTDRSRRPHRHANQLPMVVEKTIVKIKREYPSWGAPKIRERLRQRWPEVHCPAISTVHAVLDRHGLVTRRSPRVRRRLTGTSLSWPAAPNRLWCADYKGEFLLGNRRYCYPLTITDFAFAICSPARRSRRPRSVTPSPCSSGRFRSLGCPMPSARITACPSPRPTRCTG
jgi:putative transposase